MTMKAVIFRDRQELQSEDLNDTQANMRAALDTLVLDTIETGSAYAGFDVSKTGAVELTVDPGRLYSNGVVYIREEDVVLDVTNVLPLVTSKRIAIVTYGQTVENDVQPRDFLIDPDTGSTEPQSVAMESLRRAQVSIVATAQEGPDPTYPTTDATVTVLAYVLLDTSGVVSVEQWEDTQVANLRLVNTRTTDLEDWRDIAGARIDTLGTDLASMAARLGLFATDEDLKRLSGVVDEILVKLAKPAAYLSHHIENFFDDDDAEVGDEDFDAWINQGLRFPEGASADVTAQLLNPNDPKVITVGGRCLPVWTRRVRHDCKGYHREHRCGQWTWHAHNCEHWPFSRHRYRHGPCWLAPLSSREIRYIEEAVQKVLRSNVLNDFDPWDPSDWTLFYAVLRMREINIPLVQAYIRNGFWHHFWPHWHWPFGRTTAVVTAYHLSTTFRAAQDGWITDVGLYFSRLAASGDVDIIIANVSEKGFPIVESVLSRTTLAREDINVGSGSGGIGLPSIVETRVAITPTPIKAGDRYAIILAVKGDHWCAIDDDGDRVTAGSFFVWHNGVWVLQAGAIKHRLYVASWPTSRAEVDLAPLSLSGGIRNIDVLGEIVTPGISSLSYEVQVSGVWKSLSDESLDLSSLPALLPFRAVFSGSPDIMPGKVLSTINIRLSRNATAAKYISEVRALGADATKVTIDVYMVGFVEDDHNVTVTVKTNAGATTETADTVADETLPDGTIKRTCVFNITAQDDYFYIIDMETSDGESQFFISRVDDISEE